MHLGQDEALPIFIYIYMCVYIFVLSHFKLCAFSIHLCHFPFIHFQIWDRMTLLSFFFACKDSKQEMGLYPTRPLLLLLSDSTNRIIFFASVCTHINPFTSSPVVLFVRSFNIFVFSYFSSLSTCVLCQFKSKTFSLNSSSVLT